MRCIVASVLIASLLGSQVVACCMLPRNYRGTISQNAHEAVILHHNGREELVLRIDYKIRGRTLPNNFAWVITVPSEPDSYALADSNIFDEMFTLSERLRPIKKRKRSLGGGAGGGFGAAPGVELGKRVQVGPYDIQPVRGVGANALDGLNRWLKAKGYPSEAPRHMKYFVDNKFTFLCIKIAARKDQPSVGAQGTLPPLHLSFASRKPYYPLRFSSRQGVFDVNLHLLTKAPLNYAGSNSILKQINWSNKDYRRNYRLYQSRIPPSLKKLLAKTRLKKARGTWRYNYIQGSRVNRDNSIATWTSDVFFNGIPRIQGRSRPGGPDAESRP